MKAMRESHVSINSNNKDGALLTACSHVKNYKCDITLSGNDRNELGWMTEEIGAGVVFIY
jgi:hypothetical protein